MEEAGKLNTQLWPTGQQPSKNLAWQQKESQANSFDFSKTNSKQEFMQESVLTRELNPSSKHPLGLHVWGKSDMKEVMLESQQASTSLMWNF